MLVEIKFLKPIWADTFFRIQDLMLIFKEEFR